MEPQNPPAPKKEIPEIPKTPIIPKSKRSFPQSKRSLPKSKRSFPKSKRSVFFRDFLKNLKFWNFLLGGHGHRGFENI